MHPWQRIACVTVTVLLVTALLWWWLAAEPPLVESSRQGRDPGGAHRAPSDPVVQTPHALDGLELMPEVTPRGAERTALERLERGLPPVPPVRASLRKFVRDVPDEELVARIGDVGQAVGEGTGGVMPNWSNVAWLAMSMRQNLGVLEVIQRGRKRPGAIVPLVQAKLRESVDEWPGARDAYKEIVETDGPQGLLYSHDEGETTGNGAYRRVLELQYAVPASLFVLVNIDDAGARDAIRRVATAGIMKGIKPGQSRGPRNVRRQLNKEMTIFAAAVVEPSKYSRDRFAVEVEVHSPDATTSSADPVNYAARLDTSAEPRMRLWAPNYVALSELSEMEKGTLIIRIAGGGDWPDVLTSE